MTHFLVKTGRVGRVTAGFDKLSLRACLKQFAQEAVNPSRSGLENRIRWTNSPAENVPHYFKVYKGDFSLTARICSGSFQPRSSFTCSDGAVTLWSVALTGPSCFLMNLEDESPKETPSPWTSSRQCPRSAHAVHHCGRQRRLIVVTTRGYQKHSTYE
jgi:hypothetical protein